jgi:hypothetical protein
LFAAHQVAAVAAGVHQDADLVVVAMRQDQRPPADRARHEIAGLWKFRDMAREEPAPIKNPRPLLLEDFAVDKDAAVDAKDAIFAVVEDQPGSVTPVWHRAPLFADRVGLHAPFRTSVERGVRPHIW